MDTRTHSGSFALLPPTTVGTYLCQVLTCPSESFDGQSEQHFYAVRVADGADVNVAIAEKVVPAGIEPDSVAWQMNPEAIEC